MRPRRTLGAWALACSILAPVWLFGGLYAVLGAAQANASGVVLVLANIAGFGWFVVPLAIIATLVLGIMAIFLNRGKALGIAALVMLLVSAGLVVLFVAVSFGAFGTFGT